MATDITVWPACSLTCLHRGRARRRPLGAGDHAEAEAQISASLETMNATGERWAEPEIRRLRGQILDAAERRRPKSSSATDVAVETARRMGAGEFEAWANQSRCALVYRVQGRA